MPALYSLLFQLLTIYSWLIIIWIVGSMLQAHGVLPYNQVVNTLMAILYRLTDPFLAIFRRLLPPFGGLDLSPLVALITIWIIKALLADLLL